MNIHPIVKQVVDRQHVSASNMAVIKAVVSRLRKGHSTFAAMPREDRRTMMRQCVFAHQKNFVLFCFVQSGR
jgi:hypothetical protein